MTLRLFLLFLLVFLCEHGPHCQAFSDMQRLKKDLLGDGKVDPQIHPGQSEDESVQVEVTFDITHIHTLDEWSGTLTVNGIFKLTWEDKSLAWSSADYGGISHMTIPPFAIWQPDVTIYNSARASDNGHFGNAPLYLTEDGEIHWFPPVTFHTTCPIDHKLFPFDEHVCVIVLGSWTMETSSILLHLGAEHNNSEISLMEHFTENPLWELISVVGTTRLISQDCCSKYQVVEYQLTVRRRAPFYKFVIVIPSVLAIGLTLAMFLLPPNAGEKITLGGVVVFIQLALLLFLGWVIPPGGTSVPAIVLFCGSSLVMTVASVIISVIVIHISRSCNHASVPVYIRSLIMGPLGRVLCVRVNSCQILNMKLLDDTQVEMGDQMNHVSNTQHHDHCLKYLNNMLLASVIDRLCFIIYSAICIVILILSFSP